MNIMELAKEAGFVVQIHDECFGHTTLEHRFNPDRLERFAAIVAESTCIEQQREIVRLKAIIEEQANGAQNLVLAEREACAELFESAPNQEWSSELVAYQIRNMRRSHQSKGL